MKRRLRSSSVMANPALVGAITVLVAIIAVFLAYGANHGLPFQPTRRVAVEFANATQLSKGVDVREGGARIGFVANEHPVRHPDGTVVAQVSLSLNSSVGRIPPDSRFAVRPRGLLAQQYLDFQRGSRPGDIPDGHVFGADHASLPVTLDQFLSMFDQRTRAAGDQSLQGSGDSLASRGTDLNTTIAILPSLFDHLTAVGANLSAPDTNLAGFFQAIDRTVQVVAPVAQTNAHTFSTMADTYAAISRDYRALQDTIAKSPPTLDVSTRSLAVQRPFLNDTTDLATRLKAATDQLAPTLPVLNSALRVGTPVLRRSVTLNTKLRGALRALGDLSADPVTNDALRGLIGTVATLNPTLLYLGPFQTVCNYWNYFWTEQADHLSENDPRGTAERVQLNSAGNQNNGLGSIGSPVPANGENYTGPSSRGDPQFLHAQAYGAAVNSQGNADCETGQRGYLNRLTSPGYPARFKIVNVAHTPGIQGSTYSGRPRVPPGETFAANPLTGPPLDPKSIEP